MSICRIWRKKLEQREILMKCVSEEQPSDGWNETELIGAGDIVDGVRGALLLVTAVV